MERRMARERTSSFTLPRHPFGSRRSRQHFSSTRNRSPSRTNRSSTLPRTSPAFSSKKNRSSFRRILSRMKASVSKTTRNQSLDRLPTEKPVFSRFGLDGDRLRVFWFGDRVPGAVGLKNHGNTCFMNAVLQCLSHTDRLAEYLALNWYKLDLQPKKKKPSSGTYRGTNGELTEKLASVLRSLWTGNYSSAISADLKATVDKWGSQYRGGNQHDAQEFLLWVLDKVHEDLNVAKKRRYKHLKTSSSKTDEILAAESLDNFLRCNESFVHKLFQAQFRSSLTCPSCKCQSNTFDPFLCLSLPIPQTSRRPIFVNVVFLRQQPRQVKLGLSMDCDASIGELRERIAGDTGINVDRCVLAEIDGEGFRRTFSDHQSIDAIDEDDKVHALYALELPEITETTESDGEFVSIVFVNILGPTGKKEDCTRFGSPYVTQLCREMSFEDFQKLLLKEMQAMVQPGILTTEQTEPLFSVEVYTGERQGEVLEADLELPLYAEAVDQALCLSDPDGDGQFGPKHIKLVLRWEPEAKEKVIFDDEEHVDNHESVAEENIKPPVTLEECFREYTLEEVLGTENAWLCPSCNKKGKGIKKLALWSLPEILVVHLKRFKQWNSNGITAKLTTLVDFPMTNLDLSAHLAPIGATGPPGVTPTAPESSGVFRRLMRRVKPGLKENVGVDLVKPRPKAGECSYELYGVCNHHGGDHRGGHYTAFCKNSTDSNWYKFDDSNVSLLEDSEVVTEDAYVLFYHRRPSKASLGHLVVANGANTLPLAKNGPNLGISWKKHWVYDVPGLKPVGQLRRASEEDSGVVVSCSSDGVGGNSDSTDAQLSNTDEGSERSPSSTSV